LENKDKDLQQLERESIKDGEIDLMTCEELKTARRENLQLKAESRLLRPASRLLNRPLES
jgi:hypothetical protein